MSHRQPNRKQFFSHQTFTDSLKKVKAQHNQINDAEIFFLVADGRMRSSINFTFSCTRSSDYGNIFYPDLYLEWTALLERNQSIASSENNGLCGEPSAYLFRRNEKPNPHQYIGFNPATVFIQWWGRWVIKRSVSVFWAIIVWSKFH